MKQTDQRKKPKIRAAIYARYSSDMQNPESANDQIFRIRHYVEKETIKLIKFPFDLFEIDIVDEWVIKDEAETGRVASRQGYQTILEGIRTGAFQVLFVDDLSRLTRSMGDQIEMYDLLNFHSIELYSMCDGFSSEISGAQVHFLMKGIVNQLGNEGHANRTKRGQESRVLKGYSSGDICYGYTSKSTRTRTSGGREVPSHYEIKVNLEQAKIVNLIFDLKLKGFGYSAIAKELNQRQIPSTDRGFKITGKKVNWGATAIRKILTQEKYIGLWKWGKAKRKEDPTTKKKVRQAQPKNMWVEHNEGKAIREDLVIVPVGKWEAVQNMVAKTTKIYQQKKDKVALMNEAKVAGNRARTLLAGILRCSCCGSPMLQISGSKDGYYGCWMHHRKDPSKCSNRRLVNRKKIELKVTEVLKEVLLDPQHLKQASMLLNNMIRKRLQSAPEEINQLEKRMSEIKKEVDNLLKYITAHGDTSDAVRESLSEKERDQRQLEKKVIMLKAAKPNKLFVTPMALRHHYEILSEAFQTDPVVANGALKHIFPFGLKCKPSKRTLKKNHNQHNSRWTVTGKVAVGYDGFTNQHMGSTI